MTRSRSSAAVCALFGLLILLAASILQGQTVTGEISGNVKDASGAAIVGAKVEVLNQDTGVGRTLDSDAAGHYSALLLPLGNYKVTATHMGFQTEVRSGIELTVGREAVVDLTLAVGATTSTVEVRGEAALINTTSAEISGLVEGEQIRELPLNGRSYNDLALLEPGVIYNKMTGSSSTDGFGVRMSVNGGRTVNNLYLIDGTMINDTSQTAGTVNADSLGVEGIREFTVLTHNYSAEYGLRSGGVINAVTRAGTNQLHGSLYEFIRNSDLDARDFFQPGGIAPFRRNQFGGSIGGRIIKDKLFYFGNYEGFRQSLTIAQLGNVPDLNARQGLLPCTSAPGIACVNGLANVGISPLIAPYMQLYALPNNNHENGDGSAQWAFPFKQPIIENYYMERLDYHISDADNFYVRDIYDPSTRLRPSGDPYWSSLDDATNYFGQIGETHIFSPTAINDFHAAYNRTARTTFIGPVNSAISNLITPAMSFTPGEPIGRLNFTNSNSGAASASGGIEVLGNLAASPTIYYQNLFEEGDTFNLVRGKHAFKFGADLQRIQTNYDSGSNTRGSWDFGGIESFMLAQPVTMDDAKLLGPNPLGDSVQEFGWRQWLPSWFISDDWRVSPRLTLNLGIRQEFMTAPVEVNNLNADIVSLTSTGSTIGEPFHTSKKNFAPRFGFAWDPTGAGKWSVRGGFGTYYNEISMKESNVVGGDYQFSAVYTLTCNWAAGAVNPCATFPYLPTNPPLSSSKSESASVFNQNTPTMLQYGLTIQRQLSQTTTLDVAYVGWKGYNLTRDSNANDKLVDPATGLYNTAGALKPNPAFGTINLLTTDGEANYNALQVQLKKRLGKGLSFQASYSFSKTLTDADSTSNRVTDNIGEGYVSMFPTNPMADYGLSVYNQKQTFTFNGLYNLPFADGLQNRTMKAIVGGWALNGIWFYGSGIPLNVGDGFNVSGNGDAQFPDRPTVAPGFSNNPVNGTSAGCAGVVGFAQQTPNQWFNPCAFTLNAAGTLDPAGTVGRDTVIGPGTDQINIGLSRTFSIKERMKLQFRAEAFNLLNHPQFGVPSLQLFTSNRAYSPTGGEITLTQGGGGLGGRNIQFGMKMTF